MHGHTRMHVVCMFASWMYNALNSRDRNFYQDIQLLENTETIKTVVI